MELVAGVLFMMFDVIVSYLLGAPIVSVIEVELINHDPFIRNNTLAKI